MSFMDSRPIKSDSMSPLASSLKKYARVAILGAGLSGLAAAKGLAEEGLEPVVFEQSAEIGGLWNYHEEAPDGGGPAYRSLKANTSKQLLAFSDYPFSEDVPDFPTRAELLQYLHRYAEQFNLRRWIRLNTPVEVIEPANGEWEVRSRSEGQQIRESFEAVIVANGRYRYPHFPDLSGSEIYRGTISHSLSYKGPEAYTDQNVLIIGAGSSAADLGAEISQVARRVSVSMLKGAWFVPH
jgi:dimethylaniline monooxygenase (N-oxide forming)